MITGMGKRLLWKLIPKIIGPGFSFLREAQKLLCISCVVVESYCFFMKLFWSPAHKKEQDFLF